MRLIRAGAKGFSVDPGRVAAMGFSAGGHVAASLATRTDALVYGRIDAADAMSARPDLSALMYPVVTMSQPLSISAMNRGISSVECCRSASNMMNTSPRAAFAPVTIASVFPRFLR